MKQLAYKQCNGCGVEKVLSCFRTRTKVYASSRGDVRCYYPNSLCKNCESAARKIWDSQSYLRNREIRNYRNGTRAKIERILYPEKQKKWWQEYKVAHPDKVLQKKQKASAHREANRAHYNKLSRDWCKNNLDKRRLSSVVYAHRRRVLLRVNNLDAGEEVSTKDLRWLRAKALEHGLCPLCQSSLTEKNVTLDHATPIVRGGTNSKDNLYYCCASCNFRKNAKTLYEFARKHFSRLPVSLK